MIKQMISMRAKFQTYRTFGDATIDKLLSKENLQDALILQANHLQTSYLKNLGNGKFEMSALPAEVQFSAINGMVVDDFDGDGNLDVVINTNDFGTEVSVGRYDALNGLFLKGKGDGTFAAMSILQSGISIPGNGKALVKMQGAKGEVLIAAAQNRGPLKVFGVSSKPMIIPVKPNEVSAIVKLKNGKTQKQEFYYGASFLSQSSRYLLVGNSAASTEITDSKGGKRNIALQ
jgi:hypothetical protein